MRYLLSFSQGGLFYHKLRVCRDSRKGVENCHFIWVLRICFLVIWFWPLFSACTDDAVKVPNGTWLLHVDFSSPQGKNNAFNAKFCDGGTLGNNVKSAFTVKLGPVEFNREVAKIYASIESWGASCPLYYSTR